MKVANDSCLHPTTEIVLPDFSTKQLKDIRVGDKVLSLNPMTNEFEEDVVSATDALMNKFQELVGNLMQASEANGPKITKIIDKYLGKGRKIADATPEQVEMINLIVTEIEDELMHS